LSTLKQKLNNMKKTIIVAVAGIFTLASCKKEYSCECKTNGGPAPIVTVVKIKDTKKKATSTCEIGNKTVSGVITVCTIK